MKKSNYAPVYAALYPELCEIFRRHGYALAVHGTMGRDFDLVAVPWAEVVSHPTKPISDVLERFDVRVIGTPTMKNHGRVAYTISIGHGRCAIDLSFTPQLVRVI